MPFRTIVHGGQVITDSDQFKADIVIDDGVISAIISDASKLDADQRIDAHELLVLPGAIDTRVAFGDPGPDALETLQSGGTAAAAGGITTVIDMPTGNPAMTNARMLADKVAAIAGHAIVDTALWGGIGAPNQRTTDISAMAGAGIVGFTLFLADIGQSLISVNDADLFTAMTAVTDLNIPLSIHAEHDQLIQSERAMIRRGGSRAHAASRPPIVEAAAVNTALFLAEQTGCWLHISHVSTAESIRLIGEARNRNARVTAGTCPHFLTLSGDDLDHLAGFGRTAPALRDQDEIDQLWASVLDETIDLICSDHIASTIQAKSQGEQDIFAAPIGVPGVQTLFSVFWDEAVNKRGMRRQQFVRQVATNPAQIFGFFPRKGTIRIGADADLVLFDPEGVWTVQGNEMLDQQKWTPFEGRSVRGLVVRTLRRGETLYDVERHDDAPHAEPGSGIFLPRDYGESAAQ
ncbi:MAG: dihydroorotase [Chloroflexota bacterium]|nr:dihydroorotase [Chloroflexota bacterium]